MLPDPNSDAAALAIDRLTAARLARLGANRLASILLNLSGTEPAITAMSLACAELEGPAVLEEAIRARLARLSLEDRAVDWEQSQTLAAIVESLADTIANGLGPHASDRAYELLRALLARADDIITRGDDQIAIEGAFDAAVLALARLLGAAHPRRSPEDRADLVLDLLDERPGYFAIRLVEAAFAALGEDGRAAFRYRLQGRLVHGAAHQRAAANAQLRKLSDLEGDLDAYIATLPPGASDPALICDVAGRLIAAGRAEQALAWLDRCHWPEGYHERQWADLAVAALDQSGRAAEAHRLRWQAFERLLAERHLRDWLDALPEEEREVGRECAIRTACAFHDCDPALLFLARFGALAEADRIVREADHPFRFHGHLRPVAEALSADYPATAISLYRGFIDEVLERPSRSRYPQAAADLRRCRELAWRCDDDARAAHFAYWEGLRLDHGRKRGFWFHVDGEALPR